jgi:hypothetical protein
MLPLKPLLLYTVRAHREIQQPVNEHTDTRLTLLMENGMKG